MSKKIQWRIRPIEGTRRVPISKKEIGTLASGATKKSSNLHKGDWNSGALKGGLTVLISVLIIFAVVQAGSLTPPASPAATSYTLGDIYARLTTNATATEKNHSFAPGASPTGTLYTLKQIYDAIPTIAANTVKLGTSYLGINGALTPDGGTAGTADLFSGKTAHLTADWNLDAGTLNLACNTATFDGAGNLVLDAYDGAGNGANRWCITDSGDVVAGDVLSDKIAWVDGAAITGSMANIGAQTITPSISNQSITAGYHNGTGYCAGDADLLPANIKSGAFDIFGVSGTLLTNPLYGDNNPTKVLNTAANPGTYDTNTCSTTYNTLNLSVGTVKSGIAFGDGLFGEYPSAVYSLPGDTAATDAAAGNILSGLEAWTKTGSLLTGSMANIGAQTITPSTSNLTITAGYHDGAGYCLGDADLAAGKIKNAENLFGVVGEYPSATYPLSGGTGADAAAGNILSGLEAWTKTGGLLTGAMANKVGSATIITPSTADQAIAQGYYGGALGDGKVLGDAYLVPGNIKSGITLFGIDGDGNVVDTSAGTVADNAQIRANYVCFSDGTQYTGSILDCSSEGSQSCYATGTYYAGTSKTPSSSATSQSAGYYPAFDLATVDTDLTASNIGANAAIFGVSGTLLANLFNGSLTAGGFDGGSQTNGGVDDWNNGNAAGRPANSYSKGWTECNSGNNYCGTYDTFADAKDDSTGLIWSKPCSGVGCSTFVEPANTDYEWTYADDADNNGMSASALCSQTVDAGSPPATPANHGSGWSLPHQKQLMQAYIDGSYGNLETSGVNRDYWSATTRSYYTAFAWYTTLSNGSTYYNAKTGSKYLRCVRSAI